MKKFVKKNKSLLVVCDLDGTLLNSEGKISKFTIAVVKKFVREGNIFCIATARPFRGAREFYDALKLQSICINYNGATLVNPTDPYFSGINYMFSKHIALNILNDSSIMNNVQNVIIENENESYIWKRPKTKEQLQQILNWFHIQESKNIQYGDVIKNIQFNPHTINFIISKNNSFQTINKLTICCETLAIKTYEMNDDYRVIEIGIKIANKGQALKYLSDFYGIDMSHTIAFGDNNNDVELLQNARFSFAMLNANTTAQFSAKFITKKDNNNDGVANTLLSFLKN